MGILLRGEQNLKKYMRSTNVSKVSVSLIAFCPVFCVVYFQDGWLSSGLPCELRSISSGI